MAAFSTIALVTAAVASVAAAGVSAVGAIQQGSAAEAAAEYQARVAEQQAEVTRQQADQERVVAATSETDYRKQQSRQMAARRAALGGTGVESGSGSPLLVSQDFAAEIEQQALRLRAGGEISATRLEQQASLTGAQAGLYRMQGSSARSASYLTAGSSLLGGIGSGARIIAPLAVS